MLLRSSIWLTHQTAALLQPFTYLPVHPYTPADTTIWEIINGDISSLIIKHYHLSTSGSGNLSTFPGPSTGLLTNRHSPLPHHSTTGIATSFSPKNNHLPFFLPFLSAQSEPEP
ncbi:hypothetical protein ILYODFUR_034209 [Ilyodon furcidens]|uniref:Uncharacterized protein n=1 Tax=Ilyodon furcidens TaxID=33524 RepID=A0ABV0UN78_9TELE